MDLLLILGIFVLGIWLMRRAFRAPATGGDPVATRVRMWIWKSFLLLLGGLLGFMVLGGIVSTGLGLVLVATAVLLLPMIGLENLFGYKHPAFRIIRYCTYPMILLVLIAIDNYYAYDSALRVTNPEYHEYPSNHVWGREMESAELPEEPETTLSAIPRIDGSTSLSGLYQSAAKFLNVDRAPHPSIKVSKTHDAFMNLIGGKCDIVFAFHPSKEEIAAAEAAETPFILSPVGREAFVFIVNTGNPVDSITTDQLKGIYSGIIRNWREVGGLDEKVIPFQRRKNSGSQSRMERFMAGSALMTPPVELSLWEMLDVIYFVARYHNYRYALGYSFLYYVEKMDIYAVTTRRSNPAANELVEWFRSPQGQRLVLANGFAPILPTEVSSPVLDRTQ